MTEQYCTQQDEGEGVSQPSGAASDIKMRNAQGTGVINEQVSNVHLTTFMTLHSLYRLCWRLVAALLGSTARCS